MKKIAVFICGPFRYADLVLTNLEETLKDVDYDCFFHIWQEDLGNKRRMSERNNIDSLIKDNKTKAVIIHKPYSIDDFKEKIGIETNSHSSINATMGMFYSISQLCHLLEKLPDANEYEYVLRLRTDCLINDMKFSSKLILDKNTMLFSENYFIPHDWLSDHICFAKKELFFRIWKHNNMDSIYSAYSNGNRNPEQTLLFLASKEKNITIKRPFLRFRDYYIIYDPPKDQAPNWLINAINDIGINELYKNTEKYINQNENDSFLNYWLNNRPKVVRKKKNSSIISKIKYIYKIKNND